ncbi:MAG: hypothetical protein ABI625_25380 [bacterium]
MSDGKLDALDQPTIALLRLSAMIAGGTDAQVRDAFASLPDSVPTAWIEELVVQSYLFSGFPRALNAARQWRRVAPVPAPAGDETEDSAHAADWRERGEATCALCMA